MKKIFLVIICCVWVFLGGAHRSAALAKNAAEIVDVEIGQNLETLKVSFYIKDCFTPSMEEAIKSGVPTTFRILTVLEKPGTLFQTQILDVVLEHTIKYDYLKNEYQVLLPENPDDTTMLTKDFSEAKHWMSSVQDLPLIPLWRLQKDQVYRLRIKAELSKVELPLFFRYVFFFVSLWDFETDWQKINFTL